MTQMIGRGTRTYPNKKDCLILDVACVSTEHNLVSFPSLFGLPLKEQDGEQTLTEQLEEKESKLSVLKCRGVKGEEVDLFGKKKVSCSFRQNFRNWLSKRTKKVIHDAYAMSNLAWVQLDKGFRLNLGKDGIINIYSAFEMPTHYQVFYQSNGSKSKKRQITEHPVDLSWAFGLAESGARRVTKGNLTLVDKNAQWRQDPASDKQIAKLAEFGVYRTDLTKGEASDLLGQLFAEQYRH